MSFDLRVEDIGFLRSIPKRVTGEGMHDLDNVVNALVVALLSQGHVLLEGNPGLGKTALIRALSKALGLGDDSVGRIQFTPDLMPADITGTLMPDRDDVTRLTFQPGPIFKELLLADEINRATPKTQAAMLEAMAEFQVTVLGEVRQLRHWKSVNAGAGLVDVQTPFIVMATQNPIDQDGTFSLPEAQLDRFMFKIRMQMPSAGTVSKIISKELKAPVKPVLQEDTAYAGHAARSSALAELNSAARGVMSLRLPPSVDAHIINIVMASNKAFDDVQGISGHRLEALRKLVGDRIEYPFGPRAAISLAKAALGWSAVALTDPARADEVTASSRAGLAAMLKPVLRHRLRLSHDYGDGGLSAAAQVDQLDNYVQELALAAAPDLGVGEDSVGYHERFAADLDVASTTVSL
ncbi:MAG: AAA family ATPase [Rhodobacteraceae bacterium]|nr:AAA family ATPase [Paracoccaceae bacterium]